MDDEKTGKVSTRLAHIIEQLKVPSNAAINAMNGSNMMRQYDKIMAAAGGGHLAAYSAMHDAAYSEARRIAEMARPVVPSFARQLAELSEIGRRLSDAAIGSARFSQIDAGMQQWRERMPVNFSAAALPPSLTQLGFPSVHRELNKAFSLSHVFDEARLGRINHLQEMVHAAFAARAASLHEHTTRPIPMLPPRIQGEGANAAVQFLNSFKQEYDEAVKQAEEEGGLVIVSSRTPSGDPIRIAQLISVGNHFVLVQGFDQDRRPRRFKANCGGLDLAIEIVPIEEDLEEENGEDEDLVN